MNSCISKPGVFIPKYTTYGPDGFGRDNYINFNNGGLIDKLHKVKDKVNYDIPSTIRYFNTKRNVAPFKYRSDGTGRDSYVLYEHGGLERDHKSLKTYHLKDFLRRPETHSFNFRSSPLREGVNGKSLYISKKEFDSNVQIKSLENSLANRLFYSHKPKFSIDTNKEINYKSTLRVYNNSNNSSINSSTNFYKNNNNNSQTKYYNTYDINDSKYNGNPKFPKLEDDSSKQNSKLDKYRDTNDNNLLKFFKSKQKIKDRLNLISREKMIINMNNNAISRKLLVRDPKNSTIDSHTLNKKRKSLDIVN